jgi:hypothetical protein
MKRRVSLRHRQGSRVIARWFALKYGHRPSQRAVSEKVLDIPVKQLYRRIEEKASKGIRGRPKTAPQIFNQMMKTGPLQASGPKKVLDIPIDCLYSKNNYTPLTSACLYAIDPSEMFCGQAISRNLLSEIAVIVETFQSSPAPNWPIPFASFFHGNGRRAN